jgi:hypothetical protein
MGRIIDAFRGETADVVGLCVFMLIVASLIGTVIAGVAVKLRMLRRSLAGRVYPASDNP